MQTSKRHRKGPPKNFDSFREAKAALLNLADSLATHSFSWPAAAIRSYLAGGSQSLDEAFGLPEETGKKPALKKAAPKKSASTKSAQMKKGVTTPSTRRHRS